MQYFPRYRQTVIKYAANKFTLLEPCDAELRYKRSLSFAGMELVTLFKVEGSKRSSLRNSVNRKIMGRNGYNFKASGCLWDISLRSIKRSKYAAPIYRYKREWICFLKLQRFGPKYSLFRYNPGIFLKDSHHLEENQNPQPPEYKTDGLPLLSTC